MAMLNEDIQIAYIIDRYSVDELCEVLGLSVEDIVNAFYDKCLEIEVES